MPPPSASLWNAHASARIEGLARDRSGSIIVRSRSRHREGLGFTRLLLVLSSFAPLFVLWAIRGVAVVPDVYFIPLCAMLAVVPSLALWYRIQIAKRQRDQREMVLGTVDDRRQALLSYLFAMLLPFYRQDFSSWRELVAILVALLFIILLFWHLKLHYLNVLFAAFGYRLYSVGGLQDSQRRRDGGEWVLITKRNPVSRGDRVTVLRITNTVYIEVETQCLPSTERKSEL